MNFESQELANCTGAGH